MRSAKVVVSVLEVAALMLVGSLSACAKTQPEAHAAPAASQAPAASSESPAPTPSGAGAPAAGAPDNQPPPGVDLSKLDDFQKKVFFRIVNTEPSICGQAQSLIQSAKKDDIIAGRSA